jgi:tRNA-2-methylthio-N6-dimethylallyladenosine synthase
MFSAIIFLQRNTMMKEIRPGYHILTWGCQMNEEDSEQMALYLEELGYAPASDPEQAEVILLNTCSVRQKPEEKVYSKLGELRELKQSNPGLIIGVCGCMAQVESAEIKRRAPFIDMVVGTGNIAAIPNLIRAIKGNGTRGRGEIQNPNHPTPNAQRPTPLTVLDLPPRRGAVVTDVPLRNIMRRAKLKAHVPIMYGCDKFCTFCIVPFTRGRERSRPTAEILAEIEGLARGGTKEVTLLGQTVNSYGKNLSEGRVPFARLLERINDIRGIRRIRFTSPYPRDFTEELIAAIARLPKVCEHVHLPLQVADDELLLRMRRGYTVAFYREIVEKLRAAVPGIAITTDLMLGFPGETDEQFWNTMRFVEEIRFDSAFMFAYSIRPGTKAASMPDQVPHEVKIDRLNRLIALQNAITLEINKAQEGKIFEVLVEGRSMKAPNRLTGLTRTFKTVHFPGDEKLIGKLAQVRVVEGHLTGFTGKLVE